MAVPAALLASAAFVGLSALWPSAAQAVPTTPTTIGTRAVPSAGAAVTSAATSSSDGIIYTNLPESFIVPGQALFDASCASCHGNDAAGTVRAPNLQGLGAGTVDFWVSTGRMPLKDSSVQATRKPPQFDRLQTLEIAAYVQSKTPGLGTAVPIVDLGNADLENGNSLFTLNCAACHTITGAGDALAFGAYAPPLHLATTTQIVEAMRSGPGNMPRFSEGNITNAEARNIAAYVHEVIQHPDDRGGFGLGGIGPVGEGFVGLLFGVGLLMLVCFWIGERT
ncbi:MAG: c-type cytochrome [Acidimicrobiales bacterium]